MIIMKHKQRNYKKIKKTYCLKIIKYLKRLATRSIKIKKGINNIKLIKRFDHKKK